ncbi:MAG: hypothetical protein RJA36_1539 [Pseudomonadota bacterium]|jgi:PAS domain S-box-containing protein
MDFFRYRPGRRQTACAVAVALCAIGGPVSADPQAVPETPARTIKVVLSDHFPPWSFRDASGELRGAVPELWATWSERTGIRVELQASDWPTALQRMRDGQADVIDTITPTPERQQLFDFSADRHAMNVRLYFHENISGIVDARTSRGFLIGVGSEEPCADFLLAAGSDKLKRFETFEAMVAAALNDQIRVFCGLEAPANYFLNRADRAKDFRSSPPLYQVAAHWAVAKGKQALYQLVADGFARMPAAERRRIEDKWVGAYVDSSIPPYLRYSGYGLLALAALLLALVLWNRTLSRHVASQTAALQDEKARFQTLFKTLPDPAWLKDSHGLILACNQAYERLVGASAVGQPETAFVGDALAHYFQQQDDEALAASGPVRWQEWLELPGADQPRLFQTTKVQVADPDGRLLGVLGLAHDITELHEAESALKERIKEQDCLYGIARASENLDRPQAELLQAVAGLLPAGYLQPELAAARIDWNGQSCASAGFDPAGPSMSAELTVEGCVFGRITVAYRQRPGQPEHPFLPEEKHLLDAVAAHLSGVLERRQAIARQRESEERFRALFEDTRQPIALLEDGRFVAANRATLELLRMEGPEQLVGRMPADISPRLQPDGKTSVDKAAEITTQVMEQGGLEFEWEHVRADGEPVTVQVLLTRIRQDGKDLLHVVWSDITAQKRTERQLALASESLSLAHEELQAIFDAVPVGIAFLRERVIQRCNRQLEALCGYGSGELNGHSTQQLYADAEEFHVMGARHDLGMAQGGIVRNELRWVRKDGSPFWVRITKRLLIPQQPELGVIGVIEDIGLERQAREQLTQARHAAETASAAKSAFLSNVSHELRTPMNAIMGAAYLLQESGPTPRQQEQLRALQGASQQLLELIDDILNYVRAETRVLGTERRDFELGGLLGSELERVRGQAAAKGLELGLEVAADVPRRLSGDAVQIGQVLRKLLDNAVKFSPAGSVRLLVGLAERREQEAVLQFEVVDTGIGMSAEEQAGLFSAFQQADSSSTRRYGGMGLGLAIARRLVELMGGEIGCASAKGQGSRFWFRVRVGIGQPAPAGQAVAGAVTATGEDSVPAPDARQWPALRERLLQLLQDDDADSVELFEDHLPLLRTALGARFEPLAQAMRSFDFAAALEQLKSAD